MGYKLRWMWITCRLRTVFPSQGYVRWRTILFVSVLASVMACRGERAAPSAGETPGAPGALEVPPTTSIAVLWNVALGPAIIVADDSSSGTVSVLRPQDSDTTYTDSLPFDLRPLSGMSLDLFGRSGRIGAGTLRAGLSTKDESDPCTSWPSGTVTPTLRGWEIALRTGAATAIPLDSMPSISAGDSAQFAAEMTRIAASIPATHDSVFSRVPFVVRRAYRFAVDGTDGFVALLQRTIPSEATARVENVFLIAEHPSGAAGTFSPYQGYHAVFTRRVAGREVEAVETDVLAFLLLTAAKRPVMIVTDAYYEGTTITMLERVGPGQWHETWRSAYSGC